MTRLVLTLLMLSAFAVPAQADSRAVGPSMYKPGQSLLTPAARLGRTRWKHRTGLGRHAAAAGWWVGSTCSVQAGCATFPGRAQDFGLVLGSHFASVSAEAFKQGMRCFAAGVTIVTTLHDGVRSGLTATAVTSLSADPPQVLVCVNRAAGAHDLIHRGSLMCVNVLSRAHQHLAARFAGQKGVFGENRFAAGRWTTLKTGAPVLADALACFDCVVTERVQASTHTIFIGRVVGVRVRPKARPLVYASGTYARLEAASRVRKAAAEAKARKRA
jgi:flavin reductase (DIM6/NTAB) family NADH-FMN oxidoreductase RutF